MLETFVKQELIFFLRIFSKKLPIVVVVEFFNGQDSDDRSKFHFTAPKKIITPFPFKFAIIFFFISFSIAIVV